LIAGMAPAAAGVSAQASNPSPTASGHGPQRAGGVGAQKNTAITNNVQGFNDADVETTKEWENLLAAPSPRCPSNDLRCACSARSLGPRCLHRRSSAHLSGNGAINR
jgi:hypothetical protein